MDLLSPGCWDCPLAVDHWLIGIGFGLLIGVGGLLLFKGSWGRRRPLGAFLLVLATLAFLAGSAAALKWGIVWHERDVATVLGSSKEATAVRLRAVLLVGGSSAAAAAILWSVWKAKRLSS